MPSPGHYLLTFGRDSKLREPRSLVLGNRKESERSSRVFL
jgi:hypothetical protein